MRLPAHSTEVLTEAFRRAVLRLFVERELVDFSRGEAKQRWAELLRLVYEVDPMQCPKCGGQMRVIALIQEPAVIDKILNRAEEGAGRAGRSVGDGAAGGRRCGRGGVRAGHGRRQDTTTARGGSVALGCLAEGALTVGRGVARAYEGLRGPEGCQTGLGNVQWGGRTG